MFSSYSRSCFQFPELVIVKRTHSVRKNNACCQGGNFDDVTYVGPLIKAMLCLPELTSSSNW